MCIDACCNVLQCVSVEVEAFKAACLFICTVVFCLFGMYICMFVLVYELMYVYMFVCTYVCMYVHISIAAKSGSCSGILRSDSRVSNLPHPWLLRQTPSHSLLANGSKPASTTCKEEGGGEEEGEGEEEEEKIEQEKVIFLKSQRTTGWRRHIGCIELQVIFRKRATNYRALIR